jgi:methionyl-tRNA formyltransferase
MYQQIIIVGSGRVASRALEAVLRIPERPPVAALEPEAPLTDTLGAASRRHAIPCSRIVERDALVRYFEQLPRRTLVISAHNVFIFPGSLVGNERLTIINFHNSLLPRHRGRNAPSWALFEQDAWAGITWHHVSVGVDEGEILCQRRVQPAWNATALALTQTCVDLGIEALEEFLPGLLSGMEQSSPQDSRAAPSFHRARDVPNDGFLDPAWPLAQASAFLRALDFGKLPLFPKPRVRLGRDEYLVTGYHLAENPAARPHGPSGPPADTSRTLHFEDRSRVLTVVLAPVNDRVAIPALGCSPGSLP